MKQPSRTPEGLVRTHDVLAFGFTLVAMLMACGGDDAGPTDPDPDSDPAVVAGGTIAFVSYRSGTAEIYTVDPTGVHRLTTNTMRESQLAWSPDGMRLMFTDAPIGEGPWALWIMNADGSNPRRLTSPTGVQLDDTPRWSQDGQKIAYIRYNPTGADGSSELRVINADGTGDARVVGSGPSVYLPYYPSWSPDGNRIAFAGTHGRDEIFVVNADGSGLTNVTNTPTVDEDWPTWSPDGSKIFFIGFLPPPVRQIFRINPDGSGRTRLTDTESYEDAPFWSPDSRRIAFRSSRDRAILDLKEVYVMNADGSGQTRLTTMRWFVDGIAWSPDGARLAVTAELENQASRGLEDRWKPPALYVLNADGTGLQRVTSADGSAVWKP
jgi:Tol biopolymer transport system component